MLSEYFEKYYCSYFLIVETTIRINSSFLILIKSILSDFIISLLTRIFKFVKDSRNSFKEIRSLFALSLFEPAPSNSAKFKAVDQADRINCFAK